MKAKELKEELKNVPDDANIHVHRGDGCGGLGDVYNIRSVDFWEASEKYKTPDTFHIEVDDGCKCQSNTKTNKLMLGPQNISQYWLGLEAAAGALSKKIEWYNEQIVLKGKPQDYDEKMYLKSLEDKIVAVEVALREIVKLQSKKESGEGQ